MLPGSERAVGVDAGFYVDHASGPEIGPGELLFAGPDEFHGTIGGVSDASGFESSVAGVLATISRTSVGDDDADRAVGKTKDSGEFIADAEGALRAGPNGKFFF